MGRSAGVGSPVNLLCPKLRRIWPRTKWDLDQHLLKRTGRWRRRHTRGALGVRSMLHEHEMQCSCGHKFWTNHIDALWGERNSGEWCSGYHCGAPADECKLHNKVKM